jgi:hypothetical protein
MMRRHPHPALEWGNLETIFVDEFGPIAPDVYTAAGNIWQQAQEYASRVLNSDDQARARTLLMKAAAQVTRARDEKLHQINELEGYLYQTFKRVILAELEKDNNRRRFETQAHLNLEWQAQATNVERRILLNQIVRAMDDWTRSVFEWLTLDYSFKEIAQHLGMNHKVLRNKYDRHIHALVKQIREREEDNDS